MMLPFTKMHGLGNDFVVFDGISQDVLLTREQIRSIADRRFGVGCDQVLLVERPRSQVTDFYYRIFNADGGEVEQCGNGARCFARFVREKRLFDGDVISVGTRSGAITLYVEADGNVRVNMGKPRFAPADIPFVADREADEYALELGSNPVAIGAVSMGNPHAVVEVDDVDSAPVDTLGAAIEAHKRFPKRVNVGFLQIVDPEHVRLRVFERGAGETLACGTGACAAVAVGRKRHRLADRVHVRLAGGELVISWEGGDEPVWMTGPATTVFEGRIQL